MEAPQRAGDLAYHCPHWLILGRTVGNEQAIGVARQATKPENISICAIFFSFPFAIIELG